ncbi:DUF6089 family protein [Zhouia sp. PK063]|uniref:type IX secretion system protein PorG n=1 Tax=Zhouia sp. PK063 TaxID=3373602 RepID=UPI0037B602FF
MKKKRNIAVLFMLLCAFGLRAQINELGVFAGGANYIGDVGNMKYINPNTTALGILYKWNKNKRYAYRAGITFADLKANDVNSDISARNQRGYKFENKITEFSLGLEFNFLDFDLGTFSKPVTPYLYSGISLFTSSKLYFQNNEAIDYGNHSTFAIPMTLGIKAKILQFLIIGAEVGVRYTFTDDIDGSNPVKEYADDYSLKFGSINSNDWYVFSGITLTYTFGQKPCYSCAN